jgi:cobalt-zinc-cadmium efflux system protein
MRGAWLHVASDALGSIGAMASGVAVWKLGWRWADPAVSVFIAALICYSAWSLLRDTLNVLMEHAPDNVDVEDLQRVLGRANGVDEIHDLHVWTITSGLVCLSAHVVTSADGEDREATLSQLTQIAKAEFGIDHITIQLEHPTFASCARCD